MLLGEIRNSKKVVGSKQVKKAVIKGIAGKVLLAGDAEPRIIEPLQDICQRHGVEIVMIETMQELGCACDIEVGSAAVALLKT